MAPPMLTRGRVAALLSLLAGVIFFGYHARRLFSSRRRRRYRESGLGRDVAVSPSIKKKSASSLNCSPKVQKPTHHGSESTLGIKSSKKQHESRATQSEGTTSETDPEDRWKLSSPSALSSLSSMAVDSGTDTDTEIEEARAPKNTPKQKRRFFTKKSKLPMSKRKVEMGLAKTSESESDTFEPGKRSSIWRRGRVGHKVKEENITPEMVSQALASYSQYTSNPAETAQGHSVTTLDGKDVKESEVFLLMKEAISSYQGDKEDSDKTLTSDVSSEDEILMENIKTAQAKDLGVSAGTCDSSLPLLPNEKTESIKGDSNEMGASAKASSANTDMSGLQSQNIEECDVTVTIPLPNKNQDQKEDVSLSPVQDAAKKKDDISETKIKKPGGVLGKVAMFEKVPPKSDKLKKNMQEKPKEDRKEEQKAKEDTKDSPSSVALLKSRLSIKDSKQSEEIKPPEGLKAPAKAGTKWQIKNGRYVRESVNEKSTLSEQEPKGLIPGNKKVTVGSTEEKKEFNKEKFDVESKHKGDFSEDKHGKSALNDDKDRKNDIENAEPVAEESLNHKSLKASLGKQKDDQKKDDEKNVQVRTDTANFGDKLTSLTEQEVSGGKDGMQPLVFPKLGSKDDGAAVEKTYEGKAHLCAKEQKDLTEGGIDNEETSKRKTEVRMKDHEIRKDTCVEKPGTKATENTTSCVQEKAKMLNLGKNESDLLTRTELKDVDEKKLKIPGKVAVTTPVSKTSEGTGQTKQKIDSSVSDMAEIQDGKKKTDEEGKSREDTPSAVAELKSKLKLENRDEECSVLPESTSSADGKKISLGKKSPQDSMSCAKVRSEEHKLKSENESHVSENLPSVEKQEAENIAAEASPENVQESPAKSGQPVNKVLMKVAMFEQPKPTSGPSEKFRRKSVASIYPVTESKEDVSLVKNRLRFLVEKPRFFKRLSLDDDSLLDSSKLGTSTTPELEGKPGNVLMKIKAFQKGIEGVESNEDATNSFYSVKNETKNVKSDGAGEHITVVEKHSSSPLGTESGIGSGEDGDTDMGESGYFSPPMKSDFSSIDPPHQGLSGKKGDSTGGFSVLPKIEKHFESAAPTDLEFAKSGLSKSASVKTLETSTELGDKSCASAENKKPGPQEGRIIDEKEITVRYEDQDVRENVALPGKASDVDCSVEECFSFLDKAKMESTPAAPKDADIKNEEEVCKTNTKKKKVPTATLR